MISVRALRHAGAKWKLTVCAIPAFGEGFVVVGGGVSVHEFPGIVGVVPGCLQPDWQVMIVPTLGHEFWVSA